MNNKLYMLIILANLVLAAPDWDKVQEESVELFQEYLRIDTSNPPGDVRQGVDWLSNQFEKNDIYYETFNYLII